MGGTLGGLPRIRLASVRRSVWQLIDRDSCTALTFPFGNNMSHDSEYERDVAS